MATALSEEAPQESPEPDLAGLPLMHGTTYSVSVLAPNGTESALETVREYVATALQSHGLSHLPTTHQTVDTSLMVIAHDPEPLASGDLLVVDQGAGRVVLLRDGDSRPFLDVSTWCNAHVWDVAVNSDRSKVYISVSGMRAPVANHVGVAGSSAILEVDVVSGKLTRAFDAYDPASGVAYTDYMIDIAGIALSPDDSTILMCDFNNWQGNGKVLSLDLGSGKISVLADGLDQPSSLRMDGPDHVLVANTRQPNGQASGGQIVRVDIRSGAKDIVADVAGVDASLIGVVRLDDGSLIGTMSEGTQEKCVVFCAAPDGSDLEIVWQPSPGFLGSGVSASTDGDSIWVAETLRKRIYELEPDGTVRRHVHIGDGDDDGDVQFMYRGFDTLESVITVH